MKLFLKRNGCMPCSRVKSCLDLDKVSKHYEIIFLDEVSSEELEKYKSDYKLKTVPTLVQSDGSSIADSAMIIDVMYDQYS